MVDPDLQIRTRNDSILIVALDKSFKTYTDTAGNWTLTNVPMGIYHIRASKSGWYWRLPNPGGWQPWYDYPETQFIGMDTFTVPLVALYNNYLYRPIKAKFSLDTIVDTTMYGRDFLLVKYSIAMLDTFRVVTVLFSVSSDSTNLISAANLQNIRNATAGDTIQSVGHFSFPIDKGFYTKNYPTVYWRLTAWSSGGLPCFDPSLGSAYDPNTTISGTPIMHLQP